MQQSELIEKAIRELATRESELEALWIDYVEKQHAFDTAFSMAFLKAEGAMDLRKELAKSATSNLKREMDIAEARLKIMKAKLDDCRAVISARQSILSAEMKVHTVQEAMARGR